jgi:hypothetical protein
LEKGRLMIDEILNTINKIEKSNVWFLDYFMVSFAVSPIILIPSLSLSTLG